MLMSYTCLFREWETVPVICKHMVTLKDKILGVEHPDTIRAMANLAATYHELGKYTEAKKLKIQVLDARNRILGVEHPDTIRVMANLALT